MSNELTVQQHNSAMSLPDVMQVGQVMASSGFFADSKSAAQAVVKILAGQELGLPPFASMTGIHLINGRPSIGANLMAAAIKRSGRYDYKVIALDEKVCELAFFESGQEIGRSKFTLADAQKAGTKNLDKYPRNMLFARCISNGVKWYCPDVFGGAAVYTPEEMGADVTEDGEVITGSYEMAEPLPVALPDNIGGYHVGDAVLVKGRNDEKPGTVTELDHKGGLIAVSVDGKAIWLKADKLVKPPAEQPALIGVDNGAFAVEE